jgi:predicted metal-dependent peptidase
MDRFIKLRAHLMRTSPFFATLLLHTNVRYTDSIPTMAVAASHSGPEILVNNSFASSLTDAEFCGVICHEVLHLALNHLGRGQELPPPPNPALRMTLLNMAADIIVNGIIAQTPELRLPEGALTEQSYAEFIGADPHLEATKGGTLGLSQWSLAQVYKRIIDDTAKMPTLPAINECLTSDALSPQELAEVAKLAEEVLATATTAEELHKSAASSGLLKHLRAHLNLSSKTDYRAILNRYIYLSPETWDGGYDRRFVHEGLYIDVPSSDTLNLEILIDTSGSIDTDLLNKFLSELCGNLLLSRWCSINFMSWFFDTKLYKGADSLSKLIHIVEKGKIPGGGGTNFSCWEKLASKRNSTNVLSQRVVLVFTDGYSWELGDEEFYSRVLETQNVVWCFPPNPAEANPDLIEIVQDLGHAILYLE